MTKPADNQRTEILTVIIALISLIIDIFAIAGEHYIWAIAGVVVSLIGVFVYFRRTLQPKVLFIVLLIILVVGGILVTIVVWPTQITGIAFLDSNRNGKFDVNETPAVDIALELEDSKGELRNVVTNDVGIFIFEGVRKGNYIIRVSEYVHIGEIGVFECKEKVGMPIVPTITQIPTIIPTPTAIVTTSLTPSITPDPTPYRTPNQTSNLLTDLYWPSGYFTNLNNENVQAIKVTDITTTECYTPPCIRIEISNQYGINLAGIYWQHPSDNWGDKPGCNLTGATSVTFWVRGEEGYEDVNFKAACFVKDTNQIDCVEMGSQTLKKTWQQYTIPLENRDLRNVTAAFEWEAAPGKTFYLDDILIVGIDSTQISCPQ